MEERSNFSGTIDPMGTTTKRGFLLTKSWIQAVILVFLFGFFVLGFLAYRTYLLPGSLRFRLR